MRTWSVDNRQSGMSHGVYEGSGVVAESCGVSEVMSGGSETWWDDNTVSVQECWAWLNTVDDGGTWADVSPEARDEAWRRYEGHLGGGVCWWWLWASDWGWEWGWGRRGAPSWVRCGGGR